MSKNKQKENQREILIGVFTELRHTIPSLGLRDLLDALRLVDGGWEDDSISETESERSLQKDVRLLWCRRPWSEEIAFNRLWKKHSARKEVAPSTIEKPLESMGTDKQLEPEKPPPISETRLAAPAEQQQPQKLAVSAVPIKAPSGISLHPGPSEISALWPITRRTMAYGWQYLHRPRNDGPETILDIEATVKLAARQGYLLDPVYSREPHNHAHLVLLIDRSDSMIPFSHLARDLVETAQLSQRDGTLSLVEVFYFRDVAADHLYSDSYLMELVKTAETTEQVATLDQALSHCDRDSSILIFSDAGVKPEKSEGQLENIRATQEMIFRLSKFTPHIAWLNPWPQRRRKNTTADIIESITPMFEITKTGFNAAIKALRGQSSYQAK